MTVVHPQNTDALAPRFESIEELFLALESPLLNYALRLLGDRMLAEDTVQEAFMKLHAQFSEIHEPRRWLYRTVHNQALNHRRRQDKTISVATLSGEPEKISANATSTEPLPDEHIIRWEGIGLVRLSLLALDERSQELIRLKFIDELSYKEISARTGLTIGHVGYLLHHAVKTVARELNKTGVVP